MFLQLRLVPWVQSLSVGKNHAPTNIGVHRARFRNYPCAQVPVVHRCFFAVPARGRIGKTPPTEHTSNPEHRLVTVFTACDWNEIMNQFSLQVHMRSQFLLSSPSVRCDSVCAVCCDCVGVVWLLYCTGAGSGTSARSRPKTTWFTTQPESATPEMPSLMYCQSIYLHSSRGSVNQMSELRAHLCFRHPRCQSLGSNLLPTSQMSSLWAHPFSDIDDVSLHQLPAHPPTFIR